MREAIVNERWDAIERDLHDLCQPLTSLQCGLELGQLIGSHEALLSAVLGGLEETQRMFVAVKVMKERLMQERD